MATQTSLKVIQGMNADADPQTASKNILRLVERFRMVDAEIQAQSMAVLLKVAKHPVPIKMAEIAEELGLSQSTVSRNVAYLGDWNRHKTKGHQMVEAFEDPMERRRKLVRLTAKGKRFIAELTETINSHCKE
jgi:DNA-binding MarR family transcriptional regulator